MCSGLTLLFGCGCIFPVFLYRDLYFHAGQLLSYCTSEALGKFGAGVVSLPVRTRAPAGAMWLGRRDGRGKDG